jgi:hypothetical protein
MREDRRALARRAGERRVTAIDRASIDIRSSRSPAIVAR